VQQARGQPLLQAVHVLADRSFRDHECVGGTLLVLGVRTREVAAALLPALAGTLWVHAGNGWAFSDADGFDSARHCRHEINRLRDPRVMRNGPSICVSERTHVERMLL